MTTNDLVSIPDPRGNTCDVHQVDTEAETTTTNHAGSFALGVCRDCEEQITIMSEAQITLNDARPDSSCEAHVFTEKEPGHHEDHNYIIPVVCEKCGMNAKFSYLYQGVFDSDRGEYMIRD